MKRLIFMLLLVVMVGNVFAGIAPDRRLSQPLVYLPMESVSPLAFVGFVAAMMPRILLPGWVVVPRHQAPRQVIPNPPVCTVACLRMPVQGIAE